MRSHYRLFPCGDLESRREAEEFGGFLRDGDAFGALDGGVDVVEFVVGSGDDLQGVGGTGAGEDLLGMCLGLVGGLGEAFGATAAGDGDVGVVGSVDGEDALAVCGGAGFDGEIERAGDGDGGGEDVGLADEALGHHGSVGVADGVDAGGVDGIFFREVGDGSGDVGYVVHVRRGGLTAAASAGVPAEHGRVAEAGDGGAVEVGD